MMLGTKIWSVVLLLGIGAGLLLREASADDPCNCIATGPLMSGTDYTGCLESVTVDSTVIQTGVCDKEGTECEDKTDRPCIWDLSVTVKTHYGQTCSSLKVEWGGTQVGPVQLNFSGETTIVLGEQSCWCDDYKVLEVHGGTTKASWDRFKCSDCTATPTE